MKNIKEEIMQTIKKEQIRLFFKKVIEIIPNEVEINEDSYWLIGSDEWTNFSNEVNADVGSLNDDLYFLNQLITSNRSVSSSDLDRLASVLRAISQEINPI